MNELINKIIGIEAQVENGEISPTKGYAMIYQLEQSIKSLKDAIRDKAMEELSQYAQGDEPVVDGYRPRLQYTTRFSYKGDPTWDRIQTDLKQRESLMKKAHAYQQKHGTELVDDNGEVVSPAEPKTTGTIKMEKVS